jgi:hypothetical protein
LRAILVFGLLASLCSSQTNKYRDLNQQLVRNDLRFEPKSALDGVTADGFKFSSQIWEAGDGVGVFLKMEYCRSAKNAERVLRQSTKGATRVFEKGIVLDKNRRRVGERIVVTFDRDMIHRPQMILWTNRGMFYRVESSSFNHALLYEKKFPEL